MTYFPTYSDYPSWKDFFSNHKETVAYFEKNIKEVWIPSGKTHIHLDIYYKKKEAPTLIYLHGLSSCGRMMGYLVRHLYEMGYNIICPDLVGFGVTLKKPGSGTIPEFLQNIHDTITYVKKNFSGPRYLSGISLGGALTYYAAAEDADIHAMASLCLMDLSHPETHSISQAFRYMWLIRPLLLLGKVFLPNKYLHLRKFLSATRLSEDENIVNNFLNNPLAIKNYTFKFGYSLLHTAPRIPFDHFDKKPILVLHGDKDRLIPEKISRKNFATIPGEKRYVTLRDCEHIPLLPKTIRQYTQELDSWFKKFS